MWLGSLTRSGEQLAAQDAAFARLQTQIATANAERESLRAEIENRKSEIENLKRSSTRAAEAWLAWMVAGSALVIGAGVVCLLSGIRWGVGLAIGGIVTAVAGVLVITAFRMGDALMPMVPWFVGGFGVLALATVGYSLWLHRAALDQVVTSVDAAKVLEPRVETAMKAVASKIQTTGTESLVNRIREVAASSSASGSTVSSVVNPNGSGK